MWNSLVSPYVSISPIVCSSVSLSIFQHAPIINDNLANIEQAILVEAINSNSTTQIALENLVEFIDGDRGKNYPTFDEFTATGYCLFLNASNVTPKGFNFGTCLFVTEEKDKTMNKGHLSLYDIVLTSRGTLGNVA